MIDVYCLFPKRSLSADARDWFKENYGIEIDINNRIYEQVFYQNDYNLFIYLLTSTDIPKWVDRNVPIRKINPDCGIVGLDLVKSYTMREPNNNIKIAKKLGFGKGNVELMGYRDNQNDSIEKLRSINKGIITTKPGYYEPIILEFMKKIGLNDYKLDTSLDGSNEVAPKLVDESVVVADFVGTGMTRYRNELKPVKGGTIIKSEAVLIYNKYSEERLKKVRLI